MRGIPSIDWHRDLFNNSWHLTTAPLEQKITYQSHRLRVQNNFSTKIEFVPSWTQSFPLAYRLLSSVFPHEVLSLIFLDYYLEQWVVSGFPYSSSSPPGMLRSLDQIDLKKKFRFSSSARCLSVPPSVPPPPDAEKPSLAELLKSITYDPIDDFWLSTSPPSFMVPPPPPPSPSLIPSSS
jgi:hypothetical protein